MKETGMVYEDAAQFIDGFFSLVKLTLANRERVMINKLGTFTPRPIKTKISKNEATNRIEIQPDEFFPNFVGMKSRPPQPKKSAKPAAPAPAKTSAFKPAAPVQAAAMEAVKEKTVPAAGAVMEQEPETEPEEARPARQEREEPKPQPRRPAPAKPESREIGLMYTKIILYITLLFFMAAGGAFFAFRQFKRRLLKEMVSAEVRSYLSEKGLTHSTIQELIESKYQDILNKTDERSKELTATLSTQLKKIKDQQSVSLEKLSVMESRLKEKITKMIIPDLKKRNKNAEVKITLYSVKKGDTLWDLSQKYLKNPYNWVGLYQTNGEKIKNPDLIFPGQKIFIPEIKEF